MVSCLFNVSKPIIYILLITVGILLFNQLNGQNSMVFIEIEITDSDHSASEIINKYQGYHPHDRPVIKVMNDLISELQDNGYLSASCDSIVLKDTALYRAYILTGERFYWGKLDYSNLVGFTSDFQKDSDEFSNEFIHLHDFVKLKQKILNYYIKRGYPFARVQLGNIRILDTLFFADILVDTIGFYLLDKVFIKSDFKISEKYILNLLRLKQGMPYNEKTMTSIENVIDNSLFLEHKQPVSIEFGENDFDVYLFLKKRKANTFDGLIGMQSNPDNGNYTFTGELNLKLVNSFARGENIELRWQGLPESTQKLETRLNYPFIFGTKLGVDFNFNLYKQDTSFLQLDAHLGLAFPMDEYSHITAYVNYKSSDRISEYADEDYAEINNLLFGFAYDYTSADYIWNPRNGFFFEINVKAGNKTINDLPERLDTLSIPFDQEPFHLEAFLDISWFYNVAGNFVLNTSVQNAFMKSFPDDGYEIVYFPNELFRLGGTEDLRGFDEDIIYTNFYTLGNIELRYLTDRNSNIFIFCNGAYYQYDRLMEFDEQFVYGFGIGTQLQTTAGNISLVYALGKHPDQSIHLQDAKIHVGYVTRF